MYIHDEDALSRILARACVFDNVEQISRLEMEKDRFEGDSSNLSEPIVLFWIPIETLHSLILAQCVHFGNKNEIREAKHDS